MTDGNIIGAFSEDQVARLTGLSKNQLSSWRRSGLVSASFSDRDATGRAFSNIYSYKDLLKLRVMGQLRNVFGVRPAELRKAGDKLDKIIGEDAWTKTRLWVANRKVVFREPESLKHREIASGQFVHEIALEVVTKDARDDIARMNDRPASEKGKIVKVRQLMSSAEVFAGTRIPVSVVRQYIEAGHGTEEILSEFPTLTIEDVEAARAMMDEAA